MSFSKLFIPVLLIASFCSFSQTVKEYNHNGLVKAKEQDYKGAIEEYNKAIQLDSNNATVLYNRGISKAKLMDFRGAISDYTKSILISPQADTYFNRAISYYKSNLNQEAILDFDKALQLKPSINPGIYFERATAKFKIGKYEEAIKDFTKAIEVSPNDHKAYFNRGLAEHNIQLNAESCADLNRAKDLGYQNADEYITKFCK